MRIEVWSGGQSGVDQAALHAALGWGLVTGGWAPLGFLTEDGPAPWLAAYGLVECPVGGPLPDRYRARTLANVRDTQAVIHYGNPESPGARLLRTCLTEFIRPKLWLDPVRPDAGKAVDFIRGQTAGAKVLFAGNRESSRRRIGRSAHDFYLGVFRRVLSFRPQGRLF